MYEVEAKTHVKNVFHRVLNNLKSPKMGAHSHMMEYSPRDLMHGLVYLRLNFLKKSSTSKRNGQHVYIFRLSLPNKPVTLWRNPQVSKS